MAGVRLVNLSKRFGEVVAVQGLNLEVQDGEFLVLVGPSGCGKTTVLRLIAGLEEPTEGEIWIGDRLVNDVSPKDRNIAMVFQNYALYPHMSVFDNMAFALRMRRMPRAEIERRVHEVAEMLGLQGLLRRRPRELSGGQRQRVALGRAIVREPAVFLLDEPLSNLDAKMRVETRAELIKLHRRLAEAGKPATTIYVTHDQDEAMTMGDRIVVMREGVVQQIGTPLGLYYQPANLFVAGFIGTPPMNFMEAELVAREGLWIEGGGLRVKVPAGKAEGLAGYVGKRVVFGIRPTDIYARQFSPAVPPSPENTVAGVVDVVQPKGAQAEFHLLCGGQRLVAVLDSSVRVREGEPLEVVLNLDRAYLFDKDSGAALFTAATGNPELLSAEAEAVRVR
jgi:multiple sugar transport system ATP-binding protein